MSGARPTEDCLYEFMHEHGQRMEDIEAHLGVLHNSFMEVNDHLNDLTLVVAGVGMYPRVLSWMTPRCLLQSMRWEVVRR